MWHIVAKVFSARVAILFFIIYSFWWLYLLLFKISPESSQYDWFTVTYGLIAVWGSYWGYRIAKSWGGMKSIMGKAIIMLATGLALQEFGQLAYTYYIYFLHIEVPYPSLGDLGYFGSIPFYIYGVWLLAQASGVKFSLKAVKHKVQAVAIPVAMLIFSYLFFLQGYEFNWSQPLTILLDFGYPFGEAIYISFALLTYLLSRNVLGGVMKKRILFILVALLLQYLSDFTFLYQAYNETWSIGGINDYMYLTSYFVMAMALLNLNTQSINKHLD